VLLKNNPNKRHQGIEVDIVREALSLMGHTLKAKALPAKLLKKSLKNKSKDFDAVSGVNLSDDKYFYSNPIIEQKKIAISRNVDDINLRSAADLMPFKIATRQGTFTTLGSRFKDVYHPAKGSHKSRYKEFAKDGQIYKNFAEKKSDVIIMDKESFVYCRVKMPGLINESDKLNFSPIFPHRVRFYVAFKDRRVRDQFNKSLDTLHFEGSYQRIINFYTNLNSNTLQTLE
jgi:polar amino acid transport system substrate-binding protein